MSKDKFGLRELKEDPRDFQLGALFSLPKLEDLPESFELETRAIKNQGGSDFCSAYASCGMSELQEGVDLYPEYSFALSKAISGDPDAWGQTMRDAMKAHTKYGALEDSKVSDKIRLADSSEHRSLENFPEEYEQEALKHKKKSYFKVTGPYDSFDNIRASIWKFRESKQAVATGVIFSWSVNDYILTGAEKNGFGHMMFITGYNEDGLIVVNSYGKEAGKEGKHLMSRSVINTFADRFGIMMLVDMSPEEAKTLLNRKEWALASWLGKLLILIRRLIS